MVAVWTVGGAGRLIVISIGVGAAGGKDGRRKMIGTSIAASTCCPVEGGIVGWDVAVVAGWHLIDVNSQVSCFSERGLKGIEYEEGRVCVGVRNVGSSRGVESDDASENRPLWMSSSF